MLRFDHNRAAPLYCQTTGALAGFALAGVIFILSVPHSAPYPGAHTANLALALMITACFQLVLASLLYGELAGSKVSVTALCPTFFQTRIHEAARAPAALRAKTEQLITESKWTAEAIARVALGGLERGELYVIPQPDGRVLWRAKRVLGARFFGILGHLAKSDSVLSLLNRR